MIAAAAAAAVFILFLPRFLSSFSFFQLAISSSCTAAFALALFSLRLRCVVLYKPAIFVIVVVSHSNFVALLYDSLVLLGLLAVAGGDEFRQLSLLSSI